MTEVLSRVREPGILAFYSPKQCNSPDVFPKGTVLFPDQPRHILYIHLSLFHMRDEDVFTDLNLSCPISVSQFYPEGGNKKSRDGPWPVSSRTFFFLPSVFVFIAHFLSICVLCSCASPASIDSPSWKSMGYYFPELQISLATSLPCLSLKSHILVCIWNINKVPFLGCVQRERMWNQMAVRLMILLPFKTSVFSKKFRFRISYQIL